MTNYALKVPQANSAAIVEIDTSAWSAEFITYMLEYAWGVRMQRCTASVEEADRPEKRQETWDAMRDGEMPESGGGGGKRLSTEDAGWIAFFNSKDSNVKFKGQVANGKNLDAYMSTFCNNAVQPQVRAFFLAQKMDTQAQIAWRKEQLPALIAKKRPAILAEAEQDTSPGKPGWYIAQERTKREPKQAEQATSIDLFE